MSRFSPARRQGLPLIVAGGGLAGLSAALAAAEAGCAVKLVVRDPLMTGCASAWAQGGLAAALSPDDDPALHAEDTIRAGAGLVEPEAAHRLATLGPAVVERLAGLGAPFDRDAEGRFVQGLEAAHRRARVARVGGDGAGRGIMAAVAAAALKEPLIEVLVGREVRRVLRDEDGRAAGVLAERLAPSPGEVGAGALEAIPGGAVVLALGGVGGLFQVTTNPLGALGHGVALGALAGAVVADPEFVQFHPTALAVGLDPAPLATEALRGEGSRLVNLTGVPFMERYDPRGDLAPRDVVARAIFRELAEGRGACLDARRAVGAHFPAVFPQVFAACQAAGIDPREELIPVAPAAHYHMGGVACDLEGRTLTPGLYVAGECASTGVHGANRLASNSLLEAAAFGAAAGRAAAAAAATAPTVRDLRLDAHAPYPRLSPDALARLRAAMTRDAGVERCEAGLTRLLGEILHLAGEAPGALELVAARLMATAARDRRESRGGHHRADHPALSPPERTWLRLDAEGAPRALETAEAAL